MTFKRETQDDLNAEAEILDYIAKKSDCEWRKLGNGGKYRIDAVMHSGGDVRAWFEVKDYKRSLFLGLNVPKYIEGCNLATATAIPFIFGFRYEGKVGIIKIHGGGPFEDVSPQLRMAGGTPKGRKPNPDDVEPMYMFSEDDVRWM